MLYYVCIVSRRIYIPSVAECRDIILEYHIITLLKRSHNFLNLRTIENNRIEVILIYQKSTNSH